MKTSAIFIRAKGRNASSRKKAEYDLGPQPLAQRMAEHGFKPADLVNNSTEQLTYKMVSRAVKGRRLTPAVQQKVLNALNKAANSRYRIEDLFTY